VILRKCAAICALHTEPRIGPLAGSRRITQSDCPDLSERPPLLLSRGKSAKPLRIGSTETCSGLSFLAALYSVNQVNERLGVSAGSVLRRLAIVAVYSLPLLLIIHAFCFWGRGIIDFEAMSFAMHYLDSRSIVAQIFDPNFNDLGSYQARELSHLFDLIDVRIFAAMLNDGFLVFVPFSGVLGLIAVSSIYLWGAHKVLRLDGVIASMCLALFLSCIVTQASTPIFYRSSHIILSVALMAFLFCLVSSMSDTASKSAAPIKWLGLFLLGILMSSCDLQGFYYLVSATLTALFVCAMTMIREKAAPRHYLPVVFSLACAIGGAIVYNRILGPRIIHSVNGYWPDFEFQQLPWDDFFEKSVPVKAWRLFQGQVSYFFGDVPFAFLCLSGAIAGLVVVAKRRAAIFSDRNLQIIGVSISSAAALVFLLAAMITRHPPIYDIPDHWLWYYPLTVQVIILFGISAWLSRIAVHNRLRWRPWLCVAGVLLIASNLAHYREQRNEMIRSTQYFARQYYRSQMFVRQFATSPPQKNAPSSLISRDQTSFLQDVQILHDSRARRLTSEPAGLP